MIYISMIMLRFPERASIKAASIVLFIGICLGCYRKHELIPPAIEYSIVIVDSISIAVGETDSTLWFPVQVTYSPNDYIAVLDRMKHCVKLFSTEGAYIQSIGRNGEGPGELNLPNSFDYGDDGRLLIADAHYVTWFDSGYDYVGRMDFSGSIPINVTAINDSDFVLMRNSPEMNNGEPEFCYRLEKWDWGLSEASVEYHQLSIPIGAPDDYIDKSKYGELFHCVSRTGRVFCSEASTEEFRFYAMDSNGASFFQIEDETFQRMHKSEDEIQQEIDSDNEYFAVHSSGRSSSIEIRPDPFKQAILDMHTDDEERLWLSLGVYDGRIFSVYGSTGEHLFYVGMDSSCSYSPYSWEISFETDGRILAFDTLADDSIKIYQMELSVLAPI